MVRRAIVSAGITCRQWPLPTMAPLYYYYYRFVDLYYVIMLLLRVSTLTKTELSELTLILTLVCHVFRGVAINVVWIRELYLLTTQNHKQSQRSR
jgi:hypothetical protein